ncbi:ABC transporter permease [Saccharibacillus sacchari]|uniref:ABC transporter permease n=1 Tax=Saccharibacillus sacchari TaxID=456493 RepID=A0ACC6P8H7_9BACL
MSRTGNEAMKANSRVGADASMMKKASTRSEPSASFGAPAGIRQGNGPALGGMIRRTAEVELYKILAQFKYRAVPVLVAFVPLAMLWLNGNTGSFIRFSPDNLPYTLLSLAASIILPLVACMLAADLFAGERERGELKIPLTRPVSRPALAIGKITAMLLYQAGLLAILLVLSLTAALLSGASLGDLNLLIILGAYIVTLLPIAAISTAAAFASTLARSATSGFLLGIILLVAFNGLGLVFPTIAPMLLTEYAALYKSIIGSEIATGQLAIGAGILIGSATVLTTAQILVFDRKEV